MNQAVIMRWQGLGVGNVVKEPTMQEIAQPEEEMQKRQPTAQEMFAMTVFRFAHRFHWNKCGRRWKRSHVLDVLRTLVGWQSEDAVRQAALEEIEFWLGQVQPDSCNDARCILCNSEERRALLLHRQRAAQQGALPEALTV